MKQRKRTIPLSKA